MSRKVKISEKLFNDMVELLYKPERLVPSENRCEITMDARKQVLDRLLVVQRKLVLGGTCKDGKSNSTISFAPRRYRDLPSL